MALYVKNTYVAVKKETTPYTFITPVDADFLLIDSGFSFDTGVEEVIRDVINGNLDPLASLQGTQNATCSFTFELKGSGTAHTEPEADAIFKACLSDPTDALSGGDSTVEASPSPTTTVFSVGSSPGFAVGDAINVAIGSGTEYALITGVSGTTTQELTIAPDFSQAPAGSAAIKSGITYKPQSTGHDTLSVSFFLDCEDSEGVWVKLAGGRPNMQFTNISTGQIPKVQVDFEFTSWTVLSTGTDFTTLSLSPDIDMSTSPPICLGATMTLNDARDTIHTQNLELDMGYDVTKRMSMVPSSGIRSTAYAARNVNGTFDQDLDDISEYTAWTNETTAFLLAAFGETAGNIPVIMVPYAQRTTVTPEDSDGIWIQTETFQAERTSTIGPVYLAFF